MELATQPLMTLYLLGVATWAAISTVIIFYGQPAPSEKGTDWVGPFAYASASVFFAVVTVLTLPLPDFI